LGGEYLNIVFGWKPFVRDLMQMYQLWSKIDKELAKLRKENGQGINRRATVEHSDSEDTYAEIHPQAYINVMGAPPDFGFNGTTFETGKTETKTRTWFAGRFQYYIPDLSTSQWDTRARQALFGGNLSPELAWEVLPWSWLIDWFSNVGDVISNASNNAVDTLICQHSYMMRHVTLRTSRSCYVAHPPSPAGWWPAMANEFRHEYKLETKFRNGGGNPYGFAVKLDSLSAGQLAILAALGISRGSVR